MENRLQFLLRKNAGKRYLETYKDILSKLIVDGNYNIIGLEETDVISEKIIKNQITLQDNNLIWTDKHIPFVEKSKLKRIISGIQSRNNDIVYMSIKNSDLCGLVVLNRIDSFNVNFQYRDEPSGLIVFYDRSLINKLIVDFYEEDNEYFYDLEIQGREWRL